jgi:N-hydroxyarylamine O-acetyltransferase
MPIAEGAAAAYLRRLGVVARPAPGLATLAELMARHMRTVPFENLDVMAGTPRRLSTDTALQKVVAHARGRFCCELNEAFRALLDHLGFTVRRIEARVWQATGQRFGAPFDHLALLVSMPEGEFLVDVGYGDSNRVPMRLPQDKSKDISGEYRLAPFGTGTYVCRPNRNPSMK